jgi:hypothetical protein
MKKEERERVGEEKERGEKYENFFLKQKENHNASDEKI